MKKTSVLIQETFPIYRYMRDHNHVRHMVKIETENRVIYVSIPHTGKQIRVIIKMFKTPSQISSSTERNDWMLCKNGWKKTTAIAFRKFYNAAQERKVDSWR